MGIGALIPCTGGNWKLPWYFDHLWPTGMDRAVAKAVPEELIDFAVATIDRHEELANECDRLILVTAFCTVNMAAVLNRGTATCHEQKVGTTQRRA